MPFGGAMLIVENLCKDFKVGKKTLRALHNVSLHIRPKETLGLVGESGSGKTTFGRTLLRLYEPTNGRIFFDGQEITKLKDLTHLRRRMQMIFQDPYASLNPRMTIEEILKEPLQIHHIGSSESQQKRAQELLDLVHLPQAALNRFPHEFSGGQRQRIGIARALALKPDFIICDEPISALDVSIQAQIANLLLDLQRDLGLTTLFIAHDLAMVRSFCTHIAVMYLGEIVEIGPIEEVYAHPKHPYTQLLLASVPLHDPLLEKSRPKVLLQGEPPSPFETSRGCPFASRCPKAEKICLQQKPLLSGKTHQTACLLHRTQPPTWNLEGIIAAHL